MLELENLIAFPLQVRLAFIENNQEETFINFDQVLLSLHLQCLNYLRNNRQSQKILLDETEIYCLKNCFEMSSKLTESKKVDSTTYVHI